MVLRQVENAQLKVARRMQERRQQPRAVVAELVARQAHLAQRAAALLQRCEEVRAGAVEVHAVPAAVGQAPPKRVGHMQPRAADGGRHDVASPMLAAVLN